MEIADELNQLTSDLTDAQTQVSGLTTDLQTVDADMGTLGRYIQETYPNDSTLQSYLQAVLTDLNLSIVQPPNHRTKA